jgi:polysaccharide pyruvyl transferase WcaK-like protein
VGGILPPAVSIKPVKVKLNKVVEEQPIIKEEIEIQPMEEEIKVDAVDKIKKKRQKKEEVIPAVNKEAKEKIQEVQAILEDMKDGE